MSVKSLKLTLHRPHFCRLIAWRPIRKQLRLGNNPAVYERLDHSCRICRTNSSGSLVSSKTGVPSPFGGNTRQSSIKVLLGTPVVRQNNLAHFRKIQVLHILYNYRHSNTTQIWNCFVQLMDNRYTCCCYY